MIGHNLTRLFPLPTLAAIGNMVRKSRKNAVAVCLAIVFFFSGLTGISLADQSFSETGKKSYPLFGTLPPDQLFLGMFTLHFDPDSLKNRNWNNQLLGLQINGLFFASLINSYDKRSWAVGFSRELYRKILSGYWSFAAGYRVGLITGYENENTIFNTNSEVVPFLDIHGQFTLRDHFGIEVMMNSSISACFFYQF